MKKILFLIFFVKFNFCFAERLKFHYYNRDLPKNIIFKASLFCASQFIFKKVPKINYRIFNIGLTSFLIYSVNKNKNINKFLYDNCDLKNNFGPNAKMSSIIDNNENKEIFKKTIDNWLPYLEIELLLIFTSEYYFKLKKISNKENMNNFLISIFSAILTFKYFYNFYDIKKAKTPTT